MDNQQERLSEIEIAWLAGIVDGEGCINIYIQKKVNRCGNKKFQIVPRITIVNTDEKIIEKCYYLLHEKFGPYIQRQKRKGIMRKDSLVINIHGWKRCKKVCDLLHEFLVGDKKESSKILSEWAEHRINCYNNGYSRKEDSSYTVEDAEYYFKLKSISGRILNDYTLKAICEATGLDKIPSLRYSLAINES